MTSDINQISAEEREAYLRKTYPILYPEPDVVKPVDSPVVKPSSAEERDAYLRETYGDIPFGASTPEEEVSTSILTEEKGPSSDGGILSTLADVGRALLPGGIPDAPVVGPALRRLGPGGVPDVPVVGPALRRGIDAALMPLDAFTEDMILGVPRGITYGQLGPQTGGEPSLNPLINIQRSAERFRERPLGVQIPTSMLDPFFFTGKLASLGARTARGGPLAVRAPEFIPQIPRQLALPPASGRTAEGAIISQAGVPAPAPRISDRVFQVQPTVGGAVPSASQLTIGPYGTRKRTARSIA